MEAREEISYDRKAREAALAFKMEQEYTKDQIITAYLNMAYFGRGAYGIEAAAKNYFDVPLLDLNYDQAAFIVMQVKSPNGYYDSYYADEYNEEAATERWDHAMQALVDTGKLTQGERDAFTELPATVTEFNACGSWGGNTDLGFIINELDGYVYDELFERYGLTREDLKGSGAEGAQDGGFKIELTIDPAIQSSLKSTGSRGDLDVKTNDEGQPVDADGNPVQDPSQAERNLSPEGYAQFKNDNPDAALLEYEEYMMTAMVAIDPNTGAILGYYGGDNGFGVDKAGAESPHPPSSTFKMVTAATAMENGDSPESWFNGSSPRQFDSLTLDDSESCIGSGDYPDCTLRNGSQESKIEMTLTDAVRDSKNTPMYAISEHYGASEILNVADEMGLSVMNQARTLEDDNGDAHDVSINYVMNDDGTYTQHGTAVDAEGNSVVDASGNWDVYADIQVDDSCQPIVNLDGRFLQAEEPIACEIGGGGATDPFYHHLAFGQYPTSVRDMSSIYATIANDGVYNESHFVAKVTDNTGKELTPKEGSLTLNQPVLDEGVARNLQWIGSEIGGESETDELPRDYFGKTGTWEAARQGQGRERLPRLLQRPRLVRRRDPAAVHRRLGRQRDLRVRSDRRPVRRQDERLRLQHRLSRVVQRHDPHPGEEGLGRGGVAGQGRQPGQRDQLGHRTRRRPDRGRRVLRREPRRPPVLGPAERSGQGSLRAADGGTWENDACTPADEGEPGDDDPTPTTDPTGEESTGEECGGFMQPPCERADYGPERQRRAGTHRRGSEQPQRLTRSHGSRRITDSDATADDGGMGHNRAHAAVFHRAARRCRADQRDTDQCRAAPRRPLPHRPPGPLRLRLHRRTDRRPRRRTAPAVASGPAPRHPLHRPGRLRDQLAAEVPVRRRRLDRLAAVHERLLHRHPRAVGGRTAQRRRRSPTVTTRSNTRY